MLTLLINESNPLDGLFANSTTGGVGTVPDITVADDGQAVSVQSFTRAGGIITDSFVAGDALHIGIGDGVNAPVCYVALSSASPATGTMPINTAGMVALFAATVANQLSLTLAVVRTRGAYTNTIFSAPIVIRRSAINISTAVPTPSILGTGVAAALQVAINTALGFVRLDSSARLPAVDGSQLTNLPNTGVTSITGTANEITVTGTTTPTLSLPSALTFTAKTITGGTFASPTLTTPAIGDGTESAPSLSFTGDTNTGVYRPAADTVGIVGGGNDVVRMTGIASATDYLEIKNGIGVGSPLHVLAEGASANIGVHLQPKGSGLLTISDGTDFNKGIRFRSSSSAASAITLLDAVSTAGRVVTLPDATGTLALVSGDLGTPTAIVGTNITGTASGLTAGNATLAATVTVANEATDTTCFPLFATAATGSLAAMSNAGLTFDSATGLLSATGVTITYLNVTAGSGGATQIDSTGNLTSYSNTGTGQKWLQLYSNDDSVKLYNSAGGYYDPPTITFTSSNGSASLTSASFLGEISVVNLGTIIGNDIKLGGGSFKTGSWPNYDAAIINNDGSARFANGDCTIGTDGSIIFGAGSAGYLNGDGSASFANGTLTIGSDGTTISSVGIKAANGLVSIGNTDGTAAWIDDDGSASFASGACTINGSGYAGAGSGLTGTAASLTAGTVTTNANLTGDVTSVGNATTLAAGSASALNSGTLAAARMANAGVHTGDATGTFPAITLNAAQTGITSVGTLTGGATGAGFTVALGTSTLTGRIGSANNTLANADTTSMTALTTLGAAGVVTNMPGTTAASSNTTGTLKIGNGTSGTNVGIGGGLIYAGAAIVTPIFGITAGGRLDWTPGGTRIYSPSDGVLSFVKAADSGFTRLCLGGTSSSYVSIQTSTTAITFGLGDGTAGGSVTCSGTLAVTGATTLTGNLTSNGALISTPQALSGNGAVAAVNLTTEITTIANTGTANTTTTLAAGTNGQKKVISFITDGGFDAVITVTNPAWGGAGTITMNDALDNIELRYLNSVWQVFINNGCTLA